MRDGFRDGECNYLTEDLRNGVFLSDRPLDGNEGAKGDCLIEVVVDENAIAQYELSEDGKPYREWNIPAEILNQLRTRRILSSEEEEEALR